jgi:peptidoglycan/LPS O-acetylase OafA/YrhL
LKPVLSPISQPELNCIDNPRGIAILPFIISYISGATRHYQDTIQIRTDYGQMGAQLFFVVSAFTLWLSAGQRVSEERARTRCYIRRFFRTAPLSYFILSFYLIFCSPVQVRIKGADI